MSEHSFTLFPTQCHSEPLVMGLCSTPDHVFLSASSSEISNHRGSWVGTPPLEED